MRRARRRSGDGRAARGEARRRAALIVGIKAGEECAVVGDAREGADGGAISRTTSRALPADRPAHRTVATSISSRGSASCRRWRSCAGDGAASCAPRQAGDGERRPCRGSQRGEDRGLIPGQRMSRRRTSSRLGRALNDAEIVSPYSVAARKRGCYLEPCVAIIRCCMVVATGRRALELTPDPPRKMRHLRQAREIEGLRRTGNGSPSVGPITDCPVPALPPRRFGARGNRSTSCAIPRLGKLPACLATSTDSASRRRRRPSRRPRARGRLPDDRPPRQQPRWRARLRDKPVMANKVVPRKAQPRPCRGSTTPAEAAPGG